MPKTKTPKFTEADLIDLSVAEFVALLERVREEGRKEAREEISARLQAIFE